MVSDLCQNAVLADADISIFGSIGGIFRYWYQYGHNSNINPAQIEIDMLPCSQMLSYVTISGIDKQNIWKFNTQIV